MDLAFNCMKALMAQDCLLSYPNHNYQMGAYMIRVDKLVAFWSHKLNDAQLKFTVGNKELISIVTVLTEFQMMLLGAC